ncbi:MAG: UDP-N-acetylmuramate--L-alanine ligase [Erysipelothrix sp.]|jgi:UDP-N-acetylmuramate--alanine ligase|nr:UDP-N-acetylmuramate--L-alanine ligase [Erysipelothrix sp.]
MIYFIGIKGAGMASLACMLFDIGEQVSGSDIEKHIFTEAELHRRGIKIHRFNEVEFQDHWTVVVGNAFTDSFSEVIKAKANPTIRVIRYHDFLGELLQKYKSIAISGSHGKTTTTSMVAAMLQPTIKAGYLVGDGHGKLAKDDEYLVIEACEYRRHFLSYFPQLAVITNIDLDHIDYFEDEADYELAFNQFITNVSDTVIIYGDDPRAHVLKSNIETIYYGFGAHNDLIAKHVEAFEDHVKFDVVFKNEHLGQVMLPFVGDHMILNSLASIAIGFKLNMSLAEIEAGLSTFSGARRRFEVEIANGNVYVDDYAHHPTEIEMTIKAAKTRFPNQTIVAIFKPHRVSRLYRFGKAFAKALSLADHVALCNFTSIDDFEEGYDIDIHYIQNMIENSEVVSEDEAGAAWLAQFAPAVYLFMSSKDIYVLSDHLKLYQKS